MSGYVPNLPKGYRNSGVEPVDIHAQRWAEYREVPSKKENKPNPVGCVFAKSCDLDDGVIDYKKPAGFIPVEKIANYGEYAILGGRDVDADGNLPLKKISGSVLPSALGTLMLGATATAATVSCGGFCAAGASGTAATGAGAAGGTGVLTTGVAVGALGGLALLLWSSSLDDSSLYTEEQLRSLKQARTRVRLHIVQQANGTLKGYGYNTQKNGEWEMIPVVQFVAEGSKQVADLGNGVTLIWTPAVDPSSSTGIPPLEAAPQAPQIWIYPPTEQADNIIVSPIYPDQFLDFILVFPAGSGIQPLYIVVSARHESGTVTGIGRDVFGIWLAGAGTGLGSPIPTRIADQLRGQKFKSFDDFRAALWTAVGSDPELISQFNSTNQDWISKGNSPFAPKAERNGEKGRYEIHHIKHIQHGGAVYDVDNLSITTPKRHAEIHKEDRQKS
ncbi:S-type pyocin domain-containing protein [Pseudomonas psychrophila]|uniref:S-type pyocin domain-containing protein n=1 Tax=Pseudomonas psychrophila TaxID=122355 RepID=A0A8I1FY97_9PSED|nr:S-type pyocin domain-containing protein [Pseudomonas psychrophila]AVX93458.1 pyocin [Pseudomonas koreensis]MBJ2259490.1 S-type pyocin domain-containing protein [Pseudomonas psychrophila]